MAWLNNDGLNIFFPTETQEIGNGGEYKTDGLLRVDDIEINLADLTEVEEVQSRITFPKASVLGKVEIISDTAAVGGVAVDIGFVRRNAAATEVDYDGAVAALPIANINVEGETTVLTAGVTYAGALVGKVVSATYPTYISASRTTSTAFSAGRIRVRLHWYVKTPTT